MHWNTKQNMLCNEIYWRQFYEKDLSNDNRKQYFFQYFQETQRFETEISPEKLLFIICSCTILYCRHFCNDGLALPSGFLFFEKKTFSQTTRSPSLQTWRAVLGWAVDL